MSDEPRFHLAQLNVARMLAPLDTEQMSGFMNALDPVNALGDASPGFVWRMQDDSGNNTGDRFLGDDMMIVNITVWESIDALADFAYREPGHVEIMRQRAQWFERMAEAYLALWWVPAGHRPDIPEAEERLVHLREHGPTDRAFTFRHPFPPPGATEPLAADERWSCPTG